MSLANTIVAMTAWSVGFIIVNSVVGPFYLKGQNMLAGRTVSQVGGGY
jgi:hypothetical protein